jgi:hypothetical protein
MVLGTVRQEAGPLMRQPKALKAELTQAGPSSLSTLRSDGTHIVWREAGPHEKQPKTHSREIWKTTLGIPGT